MPWNMLQQNDGPHLLLTNATRILMGYYLSENTDSRDAGVKHLACLVLCLSPEHGGPKDSGRETQVCERIVG